MGDGSVVPKIGNMKALLGIIAGAGASYGLYKLFSGQVFKKTKKIPPNESPGVKSSQQGGIKPRPGSLLAKVSGLDVVCARPDDAASEIIHQSPNKLELHHLKMLLSRLQTSEDPADRSQFLLTLGNAAAFTVNQNQIRELEGIPVIAGLLSDPALEVRVQALNALNNLCMNIQNQEQIKLYVPQVLELIEMSPVNSDLQLGALRLLTNLSVTDKHQHLLKESVTLLLSLLVVSNERLQVQTLKVLVNLSSNPDMMDDIVQAQAPASVLVLVDERTSPAVLLRLLTFVGNLKAWRPSAQVADELRQKQDCLFRVMLDETSQLHSKLVQLLSHPDREIQAQ
uniref:Armadillo repeat containing 10 n=1 Tax=Cyprinodon variegatus TaxID=28743 RepID=A0A3Q2DVB5_CYPVA